MAQKPNKNKSLLTLKGPAVFFDATPAGGGMKKSWFTHTGLTTEEANELVERYKSKGVPVEKSLDIDPRLWIVSALLPQQESSPKTQQSLRSRAWGRV
jgi:hypothetical protein